MTEKATSSTSEPDGPPPASATNVLGASSAINFLGTSSASTASFAPHPLHPLSTPSLSDDPLGFTQLFNPNTKAPPLSENATLPAFPPVAGQSRAPSGGPVAPATALAAPPPAAAPGGGLPAGGAAQPHSWQVPSAAPLPTPPASAAFVAAPLGRGVVGLGGAGGVGGKVRCLVY